MYFTFNSNTSANDRQQIQRESVCDQSVCRGPLAFYLQVLVLTASRQFEITVLTEAEATLNSSDITCVCVSDMVTCFPVQWQHPTVSHVRRGMQGGFIETFFKIGH